MSINLKKIVPFLLAIIGFLLVSLAYFSPVLQGKKIVQSDIVQYIGMAKQQIDIREQTGEEMYWNDHAFGGMPTYQLGAKYPHNYIKKLDLFLRFLPRPADYLFLYFIGFFILLICLKVKPLLAFFGSLAFGFSTYLIIIIGVGHNAKAHAIGYMPLVLSGFLLVYAKKYIKGGLLFCIAMALELVANHFQMTYYLMLLLFVIAIVYLKEAIVNKTISEYVKASGIIIIGLLLAIALNATSILATQEYAKFSTRSKSEISVTPGGEQVERKGLDKDYILSYSYGLTETFNLLIPRFMGGSSAENAGKDAAIVKELVRMGYPLKEARGVAKSAPTYWGEQPIVGAPAYIGAGIIFLFVLGLFLIKHQLKWWVVSGSILALFLSWGSNMEWFSDLFINYVPFYNKFRAVTSIQVIIELCLPIMAIWTLHSFFTGNYSKVVKQQALLKSTAITGGLLLVFVLLKKTLFSFSTSNDEQLIQSAGMRFVSALREDRVRMFTNDTLRSLFFVLTIAGLLFVVTKEKLSKQLSIIIVGTLLVVDLVMVDWRYVNTSDFAPKTVMDKPFSPTEADKQIMKDTSHYRVYDLTGSPFNSARASYFHKAVGGYHGAKPARIQDLFEFYIAQGEQSILDMLNVKYFIFEDKEGGVQVQQNDKAMGNAWFVENIEKVASANDEILGLKTLDVAKAAIVNENSAIETSKFITDSLATIKLASQKPNRLIYSSENSNTGFAVFSEMYYKNGWKAFIDGAETPIHKTNYALRGITIPKGKHQIEFAFEPQVVKTGSIITLIASLIFMLLLGVGFWKVNKQEQI
ncbi:YfhO family protein [Aquimarina agarilytica]|uniref:YfhO family protein n=1 Tax=Aquimarina agarilytica TaxID=1087449 RepID=UPI000289F26B|nr:YfhO family protein [Aquimarina agarilytica]